MEMKFKFNPKSGRLHLTDKYVSNSYWLVSRAWAFSGVSRIGKALLPIKNWKNGLYENGEQYAIPDEDRMDRVFNVNLDGYREAKLSGKVNLSDSIRITGVFFKNDYDAEAMIDPKYVELTQHRTVMIKDKLSPVVVQDCGETVAVIMPMRF